MEILQDPKFLTLAVLGLALVSFVAEWVSVDVTALMVAAALILLGIVTPDEGISGFGNSATITVMLMFILSAGIARTGLIQVMKGWLIWWATPSVFGASSNIIAAGIVEQHSKTMNIHLCQVTLMMKRSSWLPLSHC